MQLEEQFPNHLPSFPLKSAHSWAFLSLLLRVAVPICLVAGVVPARAQVVFDYNNPLFWSWSGGVINGQIQNDFTAPGYTATFGVDTTLTTGLALGHTGTAAGTFTLRADGTGPRTLTFNSGNISLSTTGGALTTTIGSSTTNQSLLTDFTGTTTITLPTNTALTLLNAATVSGNITKTGPGQLTASGGLNLTGTLAINGGELHVSALSGVGTVSVASGSSLAFTNGSATDITIPTPISGAGTIYKTASGILRLTGNNSSYTGILNVRAGTIVIASADALPKEGRLVFANSGILKIDVDSEVRAISGGGSGQRIEIASGKILTIRAATNESTGAKITGAGGLIIGHATSALGNVTMTNSAYDYTGPTIVTGNGTTGSRLTLSGAITQSHVTVQNAGIIGGVGSVARLTLAAGGAVNPAANTGSKTGTFNVTSDAIFQSGASFQWEINNATGTAGASSGWDAVNILGALTLAANNLQPFTISVRPVTAAGVATTAPLNFITGESYSWNIATAAGGFTGFTADQFAINTSLASGMTGGLWSVTTQGTGLYLNYTPSAIPEPATTATLAGLIVLGAALYRSRQAVAAGTLRSRASALLMAE